jgi:membrane protease YdiL (CAAX protease family)
MTAKDTTVWLDREPSAPPRSAGSPGVRTKRPSRDRAIRTEVVSVHRPPTRGLRAWSSRHPVTTFLVLAFAIAYPAMSVPILADHGVIPGGWMPNLRGLDTERIASVLLVFVALLPAALWTTWAADGQTGVRALVSRMFRWQFGARWWILVLAGLPTLTVGLALLLGDTFEPVDVAPFVLTQLMGLLVNLLLINMWEETAWSGVVQTRLERRHGLVAAALLTAVPFALVHMPLHFIGDFSIGSLTTALVTLLIVCAFVRLMIGVFLRGARDSILAVALVHTLFNRSNNEEGVVAGLLEGDGRKLAGLLAVLLLTALVATVSRRRLSRSYRLGLDSTAASTAARSATSTTTTTKKDQP